MPPTTGSKRVPKTHFNWGYVVKKHKEPFQRLPPLGIKGKPKRDHHYYVTLACAVGLGERVDCKVPVSKGFYELIEHSNGVPISFQFIKNKPENVRIAQ